MDKSLEQYDSSFLRFTQSAFVRFSNLLKTEGLRQAIVGSQAAACYDSSEGKPVSLTQPLPESGQLFLMGSGLFVIGMLVRLIRRMVTSSRVNLPIKHEVKRT